MVQVRMYATATCPYCLAAERLLKARGISQIKKIRVDLDRSQFAEMMEATGRRTVPQIFIGEQYVGGFAELLALDRAGQLDPLLEIEK
ncbi:MAG TPA: glutaredoxin 3 [Methylococcus sp.]|nr:glutaredoxin 3 [Methylococcus sp.]